MFEWNKVKMAAAHLWTYKLVYLRLAALVAIWWGADRDMVEALLAEVEAILGLQR